MKKIAFHSNQLCLRGTEVALYTYAKYNEEILGNKSVILSSPSNNLDSLPKFMDRFEVVLINFSEYENYLKENNFDYLYVIKSGGNDGLCLYSIPTLVHAVFRANEPHGHKYFYISDWLCKDQGYPVETHSLPHICEKLPPPNYDLRKKLNISDDTTVFGYYGGSTEFNIDFVKVAIKKIVEERNDIKFIFMNINKFIEHPSVIFLDGTYDLFEKSSFVNACDAMIHARSGGETFGLAVSEFALENKPIITYDLSGERAHIEILGERGIYYKNFDEVYHILSNLNEYIKYNDYHTPYLQFSPEIIMNKFNTFLQQ
jgi:glycosyltransferase involved in cell wall biosynthesis